MALSSGWKCLEVQPARTGQEFGREAPCSLPDFCAFSFASADARSSGLLPVMSNVKKAISIFRVHDDFGWPQQSEFMWGATHMLS
jgi:hypothetical protein